MRLRAWPTRGAGIWLLGASHSAWKRCSPILRVQLWFLKECQSSGYTVILVFIGLESAELSLGRVIQRVDRGGHDVPDAKIETRFPRTFDNLRQALTFVDKALLFDNSSADQPFRFVAEFKAGKRPRRKGFAHALATMVE